MKKIMDKNSVGVKFIKTIMRVCSKNGGGDSLYECECPICGSKFKQWSTAYYKGINSCECQKNITIKNKRLYEIWTNMKTRCYNSNIKGYTHYGGRGIIVCDEWRNSFSEFLNWSVNNGYSDCLTIDRINVNGNYEPDNCRWAGKYQQARNKRNNIKFNINGIDMVFKQICDQNNLNYKTEYGYYSKHGYYAEHQRLLSKIKP